MSNNVRSKSLGGVAPYGFRWREGRLSINEEEATVRRLIYELFLKHRRKKTVAKILNDLGYRTRNAAMFSDTTIGRLLRDTTAKGEGTAGKLVTVEPIVSEEIWDAANRILGAPKPRKQAVSLFSGIVRCGCGGQMFTPSNSSKYVCSDCRYKIQVDDLESIFHSQLNGVSLPGDVDLFHHWFGLRSQDKRIIIEQICSQIVIERDTIHIAFEYSARSSQTVADGQQITSGNETIENPDKDAPIVSLNEPLLSESEAAKFLGISKMTVLRKRNAGELEHFKVGFRILYSKEKHLLPFLERCEKRT